MYARDLPPEDTPSERRYALRLLGITEDDLELVRAAHGSRLAAPVTLGTAIGEYLQQLRAGGKSPLTIREYKRVLDDFRKVVETDPEDPIALKDVTPQMVGDYLVCRTSRKRPGRRHKTVGSELSWQRRRFYCDVLHAFFARCQELYHLERMPVLDIHRTARAKTRQPVHLQPDDLRRLLVLARGNRYGLRDYTLILFLCTTGARRAEVTRLRVGDIDFERRTVHLRGKGGHERDVHLPGLLVDALRTWLEVGIASRDPALHADTPVFISLQKPAVRAMSPITLAKAVRRLMLQLRQETGRYGGARLSTHQLRHTYAMTLLSSGVSAFAIQGELGHASVSTTEQHYLRPSAEERRVELDRHGAFGWLEDANVEEDVQP